MPAHVSFLIRDGPSTTHLVMSCCPSYLSSRHSTTWHGRTDFSSCRALGSFFWAVLGRPWMAQPKLSCLILIMSLLTCAGAHWCMTIHFQMGRAGEPMAQHSLAWHIVTLSTELMSARHVVHQARPRPLFSYKNIFIMFKYIIQKNICVLLT